MEDEEWREVPGFPGYFVSDQGRVRGVSGRVLRPDPTGDYGRVTLHRDGRPARVLVHRLVLSVFVGHAPDERPHGGHTNGDSRDNRLTNLSWVSRSENEIQKRAHGTSNQGSGNGRAKLTESAVREIRARIANGETQSSIARAMGVPSVTVNHINTGRTWGHLDA